mgnify:CR=1 FL=1
MMCAMGLFDLAMLLILSAIWGSSFIFMRYLSPILGPIATAGMRLFVAGIALVLFFLAVRFKPEWKRNWKVFLVTGIINSGIPFLCYSFAALYLPAAIEAILNAMSPMFSALFGAIWLGERFTWKKGIGLFLGIGGVVLLGRSGEFESSFMTVLSILACIFAAACYAVAGVYLKKRASDVKPLALAGGSLFFVGVLFLPLIAAVPPPQPVTLQVALIMVIFGLLCSAVAYIIYFPLLSRVGPTNALTVTFLIPVFGMLWGAVILGEAVTVPMIAGAAVILSGTFMVVSPRKRKITESA